jgi:hypothetical protein
LIVEEVKLLQVGELADFRGNAAQLIGAEVKLLQVGELADFRR